MSFKKRLQSLFGLETKSGVSNPDSWLFEQFSGGTSAAGIVVTPRKAMECAPVRAAVAAISETVGQLGYQDVAWLRQLAKEGETHHGTGNIPSVLPERMARPFDKPLCRYGDL
jgi:hypothetical protein